VAEAAAAVKVKACRVAAGLLECAPDDVRIEAGQAFVVGAPSRAIPLAQLARVALRDKSLVALGGPGLWATNFLRAAHRDVVERRARRRRGRRRGDRTRHDIEIRDRARRGRPLHPVIVDGQIVGGSPGARRPAR